MEWFLATAHAAVDTATEASIRAVDWIMWIWVVALSSVGGFLSFRQKLLTGAARPFNFTELLGEIAGSAFVGVITFLLCRATGLNDFWSAALCGITGHMGTRAMMVFERILERKLSP